MTIHNHRFFCTNGLALRNGKVCKDCFSTPSPWKALIHNCNDSFSRTAYHFLALSQIRQNNLLLDAVRFFIAPSPYIATELELFGIPHNRIRMIMHPLDIPSPDATTIKYDAIYAGRLSQEKGIAVLLKTIALAPELRFAIVGDGPLASQVDSFSKTHSNLSYFPHRNHSEALSLIAQSRVGILPSICNEILSLFAMEVFIQGKSCVVADQDSMRWFQGGEFPGVLARSGDAKDFVRALKVALAKPNLSAENKTELKKKLAPQRFSTELANLVAELST
jgi:glycosyltransferase involved in cell wall biosynthesis